MSVPMGAYTIDYYTIKNWKFTDSLNLTQTLHFMLQVCYFFQKGIGIPGLWISPSLSVEDFDVELIHPSMFLALASAGKFPLLHDVLLFIYNFGEFFLQPCKNGT